MNNKKKFAFLTLALTMGLIIGACTSNKSSSDPASSSSITPSSSISSGGDTSSDSSKPSSSSSSSSSAIPSSSSSAAPSSSSSSSSSIPSSSSSSSSTSSPVTTYTVSFVVDGKVVETQQVEPNDQVTFKGETPTKAADENAYKYRFKGWDRDIDEPINSDTTFTALFAAYAKEIVVDDFENYSGAGSLKDAGWAAWTLGGSGWTTETQASVSISRNAADGNKALRLDAWQNDCDFKAVKTLAKPFEKSANAIQFKLMIPSEMKSVKILLKGEIEIGGKLQSPSFEYVLHPTSSEYMEYTIPLADANWILWGEQGKSIREVAGWMGIHEDDYLNYLTSIDFYARGNDGLGGQPYLAFIDSVKFVTLDDATFAQTQELKQYDRYTGTLADGHILRVDLTTDGSATAKIIDLEEPQTIPGNYVIKNNEITFTSADGGASLVYKGNITNGGQLIKFASATGNYANAVIDMNLDAVQVVNNFEQYTESGEAYSQQNYDDTIGTGLRGDFYSEYYVGSGNSDWGGGGWQLMPDGDEMNLIQDAESAHGGSNYASFKHFSQNGARYMPWDLFKGDGDKNSFRGSTLSFWAKGYVNRLKVYMYSQSKPTNATREKYVKIGTFGEGAAVDEWTHLEIELNPNYVYYGFIILIDNDYVKDAQLLIDDIEVYTANPYAKYEEPVEPVVQTELEAGQVFCYRSLGVAPMTLSILKDHKVSFIFEAGNANVEGTYTTTDNSVLFDFGEDYGSFEGEVNENFSQFTVKNTNKNFTSFIATDAVFKEMKVLDNAESYDESGKMYYQSMTNKKERSGARGAYYCDYYSGGSGSEIGGNGWSLMGGNGDQLSLEQNAEYVHSGKSSLKMKRNLGMTMRYTTWGLHDGSAQGYENVNYYMFYVNNPNADALTLRISVYYQKLVTPGTQTSDRTYLEKVIPANSGWVKVVMPLDASKTYYGVAFTAMNVSGKSGSDYFYIDDQIFFSEEMNIAAVIGVRKDMVLSGSIVPGPASITFKELGKAKLSCEALGDDVQITFNIIGDQLTINVPAISQDIPATTIVGTYAVSDGEGEVTYKVTSVTGGLAAYIEIDTILRGSIA